MMIAWQKEDAFSELISFMECPSEINFMNVVSHVT